ncbi:unnamed protein product [Choristocarpus tenellus]
MLEWYGWEVDRAVSAFMLGDITPPSSFLNPGGSRGFDQANTDPATGVQHSEIDNLGDTAIGGMGGEDSRTSTGEQGHPGIISIVLGLPFRLIGKV